MSLQKLLQPRICELGKIKIGRKEDRVRTTKGGTTWRAPEKLDHFIITTMHRDPAGDLVQDTNLMGNLLSTFGDDDGHLRKIPITLLSDDIEDNMQAGYVWYNGKRVAARSDGDTVTSYVDKKTGKVLDEPLVEPWSDDLLDLKAGNGAPLFKMHTVLNCVITSAESRWGGVYKFRTTSRITADQLYGSLLHLGQLTSGVLRGLPMMLVVRPIQVAPDGKPTTVYVVHVELHGPDLQAIQEKALSLSKFKLQHAQEMRRTQIEFRKLLKAPGDEETVVEMADVAEEFHPQNFVEASESIADRIKREVFGKKDAVVDAIDHDAQPFAAREDLGPLPSPITKPTLADALKLLREGDIDGALALELRPEDAEALELAIEECQIKDDPEVGHE